MINKLSYFQVLTSALIFGSMGLVVRSVGLSGLVVYFFAALISSIIFGSIIYKEKHFVILNHKKLWLLGLIGIFGLINNTAYFSAYNLTTIANATFIHYLAPILVVILSPMIFKDQTNKKTWLAIFISLFGLIILVRPGWISLDKSQAFGLFLAFVSAVAYAATIMAFKGASKYFNDKQILFGHMSVSAILLLPFVLLIKPEIKLEYLFPLLILGVVHQGIAVLLFINAVGKIPTQIASILTYFEAVSAVFFAALFLSEMPDIYTVFGGFLILSGCYLCIKEEV